MCKRFETRLTVLAVCMASAAVLALPGSITAKGKPSGGGGGNGQFNTQGYWVWFSQDPLGAYEPKGPPPEGSAENGTDGGSVAVVAGDVRDEDDPEMFIHGNATCLDSFPTGPEFAPRALLNDDDFIASVSDQLFADCFPDLSWRPMWITADGTTVQQRIPGRSTNGKKTLDYLLTVEVIGIDIAGGVWAPLGIDPGDSATLNLGAWTLTTVNPKHESWGCSAMGDFSDDVDPVTGEVGTAISVSRWTVDEQMAHDTCE